MKCTAVLVCISIGLLQNGISAFAGLRTVCTTQIANFISMSVSRRSFAAASASAVLSVAVVLERPAATLAAPQIPFEDTIANLMLAKVSEVCASSYLQRASRRSIAAVRTVDVSSVLLRVHASAALISNDFCYFWRKLCIQCLL